MVWCKGGWLTQALTLGFKSKVAQHGCFSPTSEQLRLGALFLLPRSILGLPGSAMPSGLVRDMHTAGLAGLASESF